MATITTYEKQYTLWYIQSAQYKQKHITNLESKYIISNDMMFSAYQHTAHLLLYYHTFNAIALNFHFFFLFIQFNVIFVYINKQVDDSRWIDKTIQA